MSGRSALRSGVLDPRPALIIMGSAPAPHQPGTGPERSALVAGPIREPAGFTREPPPCFFRLVKPGPGGLN